jgi:CHAT domain-containing protein
MASAPRDQPELDFEAEEAAILTAVGESRIDLMVDDTGDPEQLGHRLADLGGMPVLHLSCHGANNYPAGPGGAWVPVLMMENEVGGGRPTTAAGLASLLTIGPRLLFVSACLTATEADTAGYRPPGADAGLVAHSLATALVAAGMPAVIGWDGSVDDRAATAFARRLYQALADRADLAVAVGDARRVLLESQDPVVHGIGIWPGCGWDWRGVGRWWRAPADGRW